MTAAADVGVPLLIAEDDEATRTLLAVFFQKKGFTVTAVADGLMAQAALRSGHFAIAIFDVMMPEMTGIEALQRLRAEGCTTPVIFATALADASHVVHGLSSGADDYVAKPFDLAVLHARVMLRLRPAPAAIASASPVGPGTVIDGRYQLEEVIGRGNCGVIWRAQHLGLETAVAVKLLQRDRPDPHTAARQHRHATGEHSPIPPQHERRDALRLEGVRAARVVHPNAVRIHDVGAMPDGTAFLVMELLKGPTLNQILQADHTLTVRRTTEILLPVLDCLTTAHALGVIHRDIKPANLLMHAAQGIEVVKILDFGVAKFIGGGSEFDGGAVGPGSGSDTHGTVVGSPAYLSPERLRGLSYDGRTDVYGVGIVLYEMLTGQVPFHSSTGDLMAVALMHLKDQAVLPSVKNPSLAAWIDPLVLGFLEKDPEKRPTAAAAAILLQQMADMSAA